MTDYMKEDVVLTISLAQDNTLLEAMDKQVKTDDLNKDFNDKIINKLDDLFK